MGTSLLSSVIALPQRFAYDERDSEPVRAEKTTIFIVAAACCLAGLVWSLMYYLVFGWGLISALPLVFTVVVGTALFVAHRTRAHRIAVYVQLSSIILITASLQWSIGGLFDSGFVLAWAFLGPLGALFFFSFRRAVPWFALFLGCLVITVVFDGYFTTHGQAVSAPLRALFFLLNLSVSTLVVFVFAAYFVTAAITQRMRADDLLNNALPQLIVKTLKSGRTVIADEYDTATVLFVDIVGSTPLFAELEPPEVVSWLNELFSSFDQIVSRHGVEKIRTIGDNYMVAAGVPVRRPDHAQAVAEVALEMLEAADTVPPRHGHRMALRLGINSGPLVAGVIGTAKLQYDLWGDTVNLAARMESHGEPGRIHVAEASHRLLADAYEFESRGAIPVKGKGVMTTWFLLGRKETRKPPG